MPTTWAWRVLHSTTSSLLLYGGSSDASRVPRNASGKLRLPLFCGTRRWRPGVGFGFTIPKGLFGGRSLHSCPSLGFTPFPGHGLMSRPITDGRCWAIGGSKTAEADLESRKESRCSGRSVRRCSQVFRQRCRSMRIRRQGRNRRSLLRPQIPPASYLDN